MALHALPHFISQNKAKRYEVMLPTVYRLHSGKANDIPKVTYLEYDNVCIHSQVFLTQDLCPRIVDVFLLLLLSILNGTQIQNQKPPKLLIYRGTMAFQNWNNIYNVISVSAKEYELI